MLAATDLTGATVTGLLDTFGTPAMVVGRAPGRVNLIGEHTDYNAGLVLPVALPHATYVAAAPRPDGRVRLASAQEPDSYTGTLDGLGPGALTGWPAYVGGVLWALREAGVEVPGVDLYIDSCVPFGAGLSSSAAVMCATAAAAVGLTGRRIDEQVRASIVAAATRAENEVAKAPTGGMDQTISTFAADGSALLIDFASGERRAIPLALGDRTILVTDTRVHHTNSDGGYASRRAQCEQAATELGVPTLREARLADVERLDDDVVRRRARHIVTEIARVEPAADALVAGDWTTLGELFAASHASMRDDFEISVPELDLAVATATEHGADGARMTGGGFGGSIVSVLPETAVDQVTEAIDEAFASAGHNPPQHLRATPSVGATYMTL
ncbi:MAG: galactokinase [Nocardioides sp.]|nr:galactokinase [Nocardioides sp.]